MLKGAWPRLWEIYRLQDEANQRGVEAYREQRQAQDEQQRAQREQREAQDEQRRAQVGERTSAQKKVAAAKAAAKAEQDAEPKKLALADGKSARDHRVDMTVFGVPMGLPLTLPDCNTVGHMEKELWLGSPVMASEKTCLFVEIDGSTEIVWGKGVLPSWAQGVSTDIKGDVLVSVRIEFTSAVPGTVAVMRGAEAAAQGFHDAFANEAEDRVVAAHKQLREKYGKPTRSARGTFTNSHGATTRTVDEPEWRLPGLHVLYGSATLTDWVTIEVESVFKARIQNERKNEEAAPRL